MVGPFLASRRAKAAVIVAALVLLAVAVGWLTRTPLPRITFVRFAGELKGERLVVFRVTNPSARAYSTDGYSTNGITPFLRRWTGTRWKDVVGELDFVPSVPVSLGGVGHWKLLPPHSSFEIEGALPGDIKGPATIGISLRPGTPGEQDRREQELQDAHSLESFKLLLVSGLPAPLNRWLGAFWSSKFVWSEPFQL